MDSTSNDKLVVAQLNCHNDKIATAELEVLSREYGLDVVLVQEFHNKCPYLVGKIARVNDRALAGILIPSPSITLTFLSHLSTSHCAVAEVSWPGASVIVISCYLQFSEPADGYLNHLRYVLLSLNGRKVIVGMDANASSPIWNGRLRTTDVPRRTAMEEFIAEMNLFVHNSPDAPPTYSSPSGESSIDVTLSRGNVSVAAWRVLPDASCSDHRLIVFEFATGSPRGTVVRSGYSYRESRADWPLFESLLAGMTRDFTRSELGAEACAEILSESLMFCADMAIGRTAICDRNRCDWWNPSLKGLRQVFRRARRKVNALKRRKVTGVAFDEALLALRVARSHYRAGTLKSKFTMVKDIAEKLDREGPWSPLYQEFRANRSVRSNYHNNIKIDGRPTTGIEETGEALVGTLFPDDVPGEDSHYQAAVRAVMDSMPTGPPCDPVPMDEFVDVVRSLPIGKAAGVDKVSNRMLRHACFAAGSDVLYVFNLCISQGVFPGIWRQGIVRVIPKGGDKPHDDPKSYRPITLLPTLGKLLEKLTVPRLIPGGPRFHPQQFGFTVGKSTIDVAIVAIFLFIPRAFDNAWWPMILLNLKNRGCPPNIYRMLLSYFYNGTATLTLGHHATVKKLTRGCPQGSVLGPYLWNFGFDDFLSIPLPQGCHLTGFADDGLLLVESDSRAGLERLSGVSLERIADWGERNRLDFAPHKTQQLILKGNLKENPRIRFKNVPVSSKKSVCYLGLVLEKNFSFAEHIVRVGEKAKKNFFALSKISKSSWGLGFRVLRTMYKATYLGSMCYGSPVWADRAALGVARRKLLQSQRVALIFLTKAYRTVSTDCLPVLAGVLPVDLEARRRAALHFSKKQLKSDFVAQPDRARIASLFLPYDEAYDALMSEWQDRWETTTKGRHLYQFFPSVHDRMKCQWLDIDHSVTQFLVGHGNFKSKLFSFGLKDSPLCECSAPGAPSEQSAHHILWECPLWASERTVMLNSISGVGPVYYQHLVATPSNFRAFKSFCSVYYWNQSK